MGVKGSSFNIGDQGVFFSAVDFGCRTSKTAAQNTSIIISALNTIKNAGGGVLLVPHGIANTFNPSTDFPATPNALMVWNLAGDKFQIYSNTTAQIALGGTISGTTFLTPKAVSYRLIDAVPQTYEFRFEVYNNSGSPVIAGSSFDLCVFLPGGSSPVAAFARSGPKLGALYTFNGIVNTGLIETDTLKLNGQSQNSKSIQVPASGASIQIADDINYLVLNHSATISTLTVTLPQNPKDGNVVKIYARSAVTTLTLAAGSGETIETGHTVTTIAALSSYEYIFNSSDSKWYRVR